jgi:hypothetical protein
VVDADRLLAEELQGLCVGAFMCGICREEHSLEDVWEVAGCGHRFCRECAKRHVMTEVGNRQIPIRCPNCLAEGQTTEVDQVSGVDKTQRQVYGVQG